MVDEIRFMAHCLSFVSHFISRPSLMRWSPEHVQLIAVIYAMIGSKRITARCSCIWPTGKARKMYYLIHQLGENSGSHQRDVAERNWLSISLSVANQVWGSSPPPRFFLHSGGCSIGRRVQSMPSVVSCLACAVWPTSLCSPVSAGSRSAAQTMVRPPVLNTFFYVKKKKAIRNSLFKTHKTYNKYH